MNKHDIETEGKPSASGFDANFRCLGKANLEKQVPDEEPDSDAAVRGNKIHAALAKSDLSGLSDSDQITASRCMFAESKLIHDFGFEGATAWWEDCDIPDLNLERLWYIDDDLNPRWSAKLDSLHLSVDRERALVPDYKTGWSSPAPVKRNWQIRAQAALAMFADASPANGVQNVVAALIHPHHPDSLYEVGTFTAKELEADLVTINVNVAAMQEPDAPRTPNEVSCHFCRAKDLCPEYKADMARLALAVADRAEDKGFTYLLAMSEADRGQYVGQLKMMQKHAKAELEKLARFAEKSGKDSILGWTLRHSWNRKVTDEGAALTLVRKEFGETAAAAAMSFSLVDLENYLGATLGKREAKEAVEAAMRPLVKFVPKEAYLAERKV